MFDELEIVELTHDIKKYNLNEGERGTVVEVYKNGQAYEVEFVEPGGKTKALLSLKLTDIRSIEKGEFISAVKVDYFVVTGGTVSINSSPIPDTIDSVKTEVFINTDSSYKRDFYHPQL